METPAKRRGCEESSTKDRDFRQCHRRRQWREDGGFYNPEKMKLIRFSQKKGDERTGMA